MIRSDFFWLPKAGNRSEEYEDAVWPAKPLILDPPAISYAIADGATEASFAGLWASLLVQSFCRGHLEPRRRRKTLQRLRQCWLEEASRNPLPWYAEAKLQQGSAAALLGLRLSRERPEIGTWHAKAWGDCCLFQIRQGRLLQSFPIAAAADFGSRPSLIGSNMPKERLDDLEQAASGQWQRGDRIYLSSDALACFLLAEHEVGRDWWPILEQMDEQSFVWLVAVTRDQKLMRNDDVTCVRIFFD